MMRLFVILAVVAGGLAQTCPVGQGWQPGADTEAVALSRMVGTFLPIRCKLWGKTLCHGMAIDLA